MIRGAGPVRVFSCGIFRNEYQLLPEDLRSSLSPVFLSSMLHMEPERLDDLLGSCLRSAGGRSTLILFGDCCPHMQELDCVAGNARTEGVNCCEIYLGCERYRQLRRERTFFLMPEWAGRWEHVVKHELGLEDKQLARDFMSQSMNKAVYIDTGVLAVPEADLMDFTEHTGLAVQVETVGPEHFLEAVIMALRRIDEGSGCSENRSAQARAKGN